jgi:ABC-type bacteriocin/lantibiotic exporter with double-glycine peptidase domain
MKGQAMSTDNPVGYVPQSTNNTCWAASTAMLLGWNDDMQVVQDMKEKFPDSVWDDGATELELGQVAQAYGFTQIYPVCQGPDGWDQWLNDNGPLLIQVPGNAYHSIVVAGIRGGEQENTSEQVEVHVLDPWNGDQWLPFDTFNSNYELAGAGWENNVYRR